MNKSVLIISSSMRKNSNSDMLAEAFAKGAEEAGNKVEIIRLRDKEIKYCIGCLSGQRTGKCVLKDDAAEIVEKAKKADVIAFASPVYYYSISGQLKTMLDRLNPLFAADYKFRDIYFLATAYENEKTTVSGAKTAVQGWVDCFEKARLAGTIFAGGVNEPGEIKDHPQLEKAYTCGKKI